VDTAAEPVATVGGGPPSGELFFISGRERAYERDYCREGRYCRLRKRNFRVGIPRKRVAFRRVVLEQLCQPPTGRIPKLPLSWFGRCSYIQKRISSAEQIHPALDKKVNSRGVTQCRAACYRREQAPRCNTQPRPKST
jgi:hypothetical protein